jgi:hypothetical protein
MNVSLQEKIFRMGGEFRQSTKTKGVDVNVYGKSHESRLSSSDLSPPVLSLLNYFSGLFLRIIKV